jgi:hypothetical protein
LERNSFTVLLPVCLSSLTRGLQNLAYFHASAHSISLSLLPVASFPCHCCRFFILIHCLLGLFPVSWQQGCIIPPAPWPAPWILQRVNRCGPKATEEHQQRPVANQGRLPLPALDWRQAATRARSRGGREVQRACSAASAKPQRPSRHRACHCASQSAASQSAQGAAST